MRLKRPSKARGYRDQARVDLLRGGSSNGQTT
jgi:hypothetical protein